MRSPASRTLLLLALTIRVLQAQTAPPAATATTTVLASSMDPSTLRQSVTLTATVTPVAASGKVTFYDGVSILETEPLVNGQAALATILLTSGPRSVTAFYGGDGTYAPGTSSPLEQIVVPLSANGFQAALSYPTGTQIGPVLAVGDFNGDGKPDLASVDQQGVIVLLGNGDGTFQAPVQYPTPSAPATILAGDFNGDGKIDLAAVEAGAVGVLLGNGDGTFQPQIASATGPGSVFMAAVADFNGDGKADIAVLSNNVLVYNPGNFPNGGSFGVLLGNGDGTFQPPTSIGLFDDPAALAVGDFNGDGVADLAVCLAGNFGGSIEVFTGKGDGTFQQPPPAPGPAGTGPVAYPLPYETRPLSVLAGDFNGDGKLDLLTPVYVLLGNGDGSFQTAVNYAGEINPYVSPAETVTAIGDVNGDGRLDVLQDHSTTLGMGGVVNLVSVRLGNGDGTFNAGTNYVAGANSGPLALADFNGDGRLDIAAAGAVLLGESSVVPASLTIVSGNNQSGATLTMLGQNLVVETLGSDGNPYLGAPVTFAVVTGSASISPATVTTGSNGMAAAQLSLGAAAGAIQITASVPGLPSVTFSETALSFVPQISAGGVVSAGLSQPPIQIVSPNAIIAIWGQNFAPTGTNDVANGAPPTNLAGVCVMFGNQAAPMLMVTPGELNVQAPQLPPSPSTVAVQVTANCGAPNQSVSNTVTVATQAAAPEFFYAAQGADGMNPVDAVDGLTGAKIGDPAELGAGFTLAYPGEILVIYSTGLGFTTPAYAPGQVAGLAQVNGLTVSIDGTALVPSSIQYAGTVPGSVGLYQLNLALPFGLTPGNHTIVMSIDGASSPSSAYIAVGATQ